MRTTIDASQLRVTGCLGSGVNGIVFSAVSPALPTNAALKVYLTASVEERARRRFHELRNAGQEVALDDVIESISARDYDDMNRPIAPLKQAEDAILVDSTDMPIETVVNVIVEAAQKVGRSV